MRGRVSALRLETGVKQLPAIRLYEAAGFARRGPFGSYPADWLRTIDKLRAYDFQVLVPGHGAPQRDRAYLDRLAAAIAEVRAKVEPLAKQGMSLEEVRKQLAFSEQARGFVGDDPWLRRWFGEYWITPFLASAYKEANGQPIVQRLTGE